MVMKGLCIAAEGHIVSLASFAVPRVHHCHKVVWVIAHGARPAREPASKEGARYAVTHTHIQCLQPASNQVAVPACYQSHDLGQIFKFISETQHFVHLAANCSTSHVWNAGQAGWSKGRGLRLARELASYSMDKWRGYSGLWPSSQAARSFNGR